MAAIYLIRHGQASFGKADYDQLSEKGGQRAHILGQHLSSLTMANNYYYGNMLRHRQTLSHFNIGAKQTDIPSIVHSGFDEFDHLDILACLDLRWENSVSMSAELERQPDGNKVLQKQFSKALKRWIENDEVDGVGEYRETWSQFKQRCISALHDVIKQHSKERHTAENQTVGNDIFIFTSGAPISIIIQYVLALSDDQTLVINRQIRNTSVTKFLFSGNNLSLDYFNNYSHLETKGTDWLTYR